MSSVTVLYEFTVLRICIDAAHRFQAVICVTVRQLNRRAISNGPRRHDHEMLAD